MPAIDPSSYQMIKVSTHEGVVTLSLNNPARKNAVTRQMHSELERVWMMWTAMTIFASPY